MDKETLNAVTQDTPETSDTQRIVEELAALDEQAVEARLADMQEGQVVEIHDLLITQLDALAEVNEPGEKTEAAFDQKDRLLRQVRARRGSKTVEGD